MQLGSAAKIVIDDRLKGISIVYSVTSRSRFTGLVVHLGQVARDVTLASEGGGTARNGTAEPDSIRLVGFLMFPEVELAIERMRAVKATKLFALVSIRARCCDRGTHYGRR